jgi:hypothetical protein
MRLSIRIRSLGAALAFCVAAPPAQAQDAVFTRTYVRASGHPVMVSDSFSVCDAAGQFSLLVENGPDGAPRASAGAIFVNDAQVVGPSDFNQRVDRIERPLPGLAAENTIGVRLGSAPGATVRVSVLGVQSCGMRITSPAAGSTVTGPDVLVQGTLPASFGADVGVTVNGERALAGGGRFAAVVPVDVQVTSLTAVARNPTGATLDDDTVAVTVQAGPDAGLVHLRASPAVGIAPLSVELKLISMVPVGQIALDQDGDGVTDFQGTTLDGLRFTYGQSGVFLAAATVSGAAGSHLGTTLVQVYDRVELEAVLQARWLALRNALRAGDIEGALQLVSAGARARYRAAFEALAADLPQIDAILGGLTFVRAWGPEAVFEMQRTDDGALKAFEVRFAVDEDGLWRVSSF